MLLNFVILIMMLGVLPVRSCPRPHHMESYRRRFEPPDNSTLYQPRDDSMSAFDKRWYAIYGPNSLFWPEARILYCFPAAQMWSTAEQNAMREMFRDAWNMWVDAGVDSTRLTFREGNSFECQASPYDILSILKNHDEADGSVATTIGHGPLANAGNGGPSMEIGEAFVDVWISADPNDSADEATYASLLETMAHEIGHAWGLLHEHQRPSLWDSSQYPDGTGHRAQFHFECANLEDYDHVKSVLNDLNRLRQACTQFSMTTFPPQYNLPQFLAAEFLPQPSTAREEYTEDAALPLDVNSIMLYPSTTFGVEIGEDSYEAVIFDLNGDLFGENGRTVSAQDVRNLNLIYGGASFTHDGFQPFFFPASQYNLAYHSSIDCDNTGYIET